MAISQRNRAVSLPTSPSDSLGATTQFERHEPGAAPTTTKRVVAVVRGDRMDAELIKLACSVARGKQANVMAIYCIEVPFAEPLESPQPQHEPEARRVLEQAAAIAERYESDIETEIVQCRSVAHGIIQEVNDSDCVLLIMGAPYQEHHGGACMLEERIDYVMEHATCRVWLIRGSKQEAGQA